MKIQEVSKDVTEGGILLPSSKTSYIEANTLKGEETDVFSTCRTHMRQGAQMEAPSAQAFTLKLLVREK